MIVLLKAARALSRSRGEVGGELAGELSGEPACELEGLPPPPPPPLPRRSRRSDMERSRDRGDKIGAAARNDCGEPLEPLLEPLYLMLSKLAPESRRSELLPSMHSWSSTRFVISDLGDDLGGRSQADGDGGGGVESVSVDDGGESMITA